MLGSAPINERMAAIDSLPPWIAGITPNLFSQALQAGARVGLELTDQSIRAQALAQAQAQRQAEAQERAERAAERQREFEETRLLNVQKIAQDAAQLQQLQKHQAEQESRLLGYDTGRLALEKRKQDFEETPTAFTVQDFGPGVGKAVVHGKSLSFPPFSATGTQHKLGEVFTVNDPITKEVLGSVIATGPNTGHFQKAEGITLTAPQQVQVERARMSVINAELENVDRLGMKEDEQKQFIQSRMEALQDVNSKLLDLSSGARKIGKSTKRRVRVVGPNGRTGTIEEGDTLPSGWQLQTQ